MKNIALVIAGGSGTRTGQSIPKQFLTVDDKPIIIYTLERLDKIKEIDKIIVVIPNGWEAFLNSYISQYDIKKVEKLVIGGNNRHESIFNGIKFSFENDDKDDCLLIIDANRPLIPEQVITENIVACNKDNSFTLSCEPCYDSMFVSSNQELIEKSVNRDELYKGQTPEAGKVGLLYDLYIKANEDKITDRSMSELCLYYKKQVKLIEGSSKSFKITTKDDIEIFKSLINLQIQNLK